MALNPKQEAFCQEYVKDLNATQAYLRAYPDSKPNSARTQAAKLMAKNNIQSRIQELQEKSAKRNDVTQDLIIKRLADIAFAHIGLICVWGADGQLELKDQADLSEASLAAIDSIQTVPIGDGEGGLLGYNRKVKMKDSLKALELLSRHLGILDGNGKEKDQGAVKQRLRDAIERLRNRPRGGPSSD